jgi:hypothetical protein
MKIIFLLFSLFTTINLFGQAHSISVNYLPSITTFGKQKQSFNHYHFKSRNGKTTFNSAANVLYKFQATPKIGIGMGLEFSPQGQNIQFETNSAIVESKGNTYSTELNYFRIPLTVNYAIVNRNKNKLIVYSGLNVGFATKRKDNYNDIIFEAILLAPAEERYKDNDFAIPVGINLQRKLCNKIFASFSFEQMFGITNSFSDNSFSRFGVLSEFKNSKQNRTSLNIGLGINLTK